MKLRLILPGLFALVTPFSYAQDAPLTTDVLSDPGIVHQDELADLQRRLEIASLRFLIASEIAKIAEEEAKTAVSQAEGAEKLKEKTVAEATSRQGSPNRIAMVTSRLTTGPNRRELCDLKWYMAYSCNGLPECAVNLEKSACAEANLDGLTLDLTIQYACGKPDDEGYETRRGEFTFASLDRSPTAYLTCY